MSPCYSNEELSNSVFCCMGGLGGWGGLVGGLDGRLIPEYSGISDLLVYADWNMRWTDPKADVIGRLEEIIQMHAGPEQPPQEEINELDPLDLFRPANAEEIRGRIEGLRADRRQDHGYGRDLMTRLKSMRLKCSSDRPIPLVDIGIEALGYHAVEHHAPDGFVMTEAEKTAYTQAYKAGPASVNPWAREITVVKRTGRGRRPIRLLYIGAEGLATYGALYQRGTIAPRVLWAGHSDVMARLIACCNVQPAQWLQEL